MKVYLLFRDEDSCLDRPERLIDSYASPEACFIANPDKKFGDKIESFLEWYTDDYEYTLYEKELNYG
jgi:hypothetical protein